jgi:4-diphosphocytidyl-2-C-methyl-D-erythritol kinase
VRGVHYISKAKLNLFLHVLGLESNSFHDLQSLVYFPNIYDELSFSLHEHNEIIATGEFSAVLPPWQENSIYKVINFFQESFAIKEKIRVELHKNLPLGGGIGGGSSNTAITIMAMNELFNLGLSFAEKLEIAKKFGSDVPVCLYQSHSGAMFEGKGEMVRAVNLPEIPLLLINPMQPLLTGDVFKKYDEVQQIHSSKIELPDVNNFNSLINFLKNTKNDLSAASIFLNKNISHILVALEETSPCLSRMSGSGSTCFAIYENNQSLEDAYKKLQILYPNYWIAISKTTNNAII